MAGILLLLLTSTKVVTNSQTQNMQPTDGILNFLIITKPLMTFQKHKSKHGGKALCDNYHLFSGVL